MCIELLVSFRFQGKLAFVGFLSEGLVVQIELVKMPQWTKRILRRNGGKGTVTDAAEDTDVKAPKLMEFIEVSNPKDAKAGLRIQFKHDGGEGTVYWLEGKIERRITKLSRAIKLKYAENYFRVGELKVLSRWGEATKPLPDKVCTNLTGNLGWTKLTETSNRLPVGEESIIELDLDAIPSSKREEEVNQEADLYKVFMLVHLFTSMCV